MSETDSHLFGNGDLLVKVMGYWPSFHDSNVKDLLRKGDSCRVVLHLFEMTNEVDPSGYYMLTKHHLVTIQMTDIVECTLPTDYRSDVLFGLSAQREGDLVRVLFDSAIDPNLTWEAVCGAVTLTDVLPCGARGEALAPE